jgi:hypothetical protein
MPGTKDWWSDAKLYIKERGEDAFALSSHPLPFFLPHLPFLTPAYFF